MSGLPSARRVRLPDWMNPHHPVTRMVLRHAPMTSSHRWARWIGGGLSLLFVAAIVVSSVMAYWDGALDELFLSGEAWWFVVPYFPLLLLQAGLLMGAPRQVFGLGLTLSGTPTDVQRESWELVKVTSAGAALVTRARWIALLYRVRGLLIVILALRLVFALTIVFRMVVSWDRLRAALVDGAPGLPPGLGLALVIVLLVGTQVIFPALLLFAASYGVFASVIIPRHRYGLWVVLHQGIVFIAMLVFSVTMLVGWSALFPRQWTVYYRGNWRIVSVFAMLVTGDQGLRLLSWDALLEIIGGVEYGVWLGVPLLALAVILVALSIGLLRWAARRAARPGRE